MKYSLAQFLGTITLLTLLFAALRHLYGNPDAFIGIAILALPVHAIVYDLVEHMMRSGTGRKVLASADPHGIAHQTEATRCRKGYPDFRVRD
jgi:hypothetical protein